MVITPGLKYAVVNDAAITIYTPGAVNLGAGYAAGYAKELVIDGFSVAPKTGQLMALGDTTATAMYGLLTAPTTTAMLPNRPLDALVANDAAVNIGPAGEYNFAFHKNAISFVTRPLAVPMVGTGALSSVANDRGIGVRVTITYDGTAQGHLVTVDMLCGIKTLDTRLGCLVYA